MFFTKGVGKHQRSLQSFEEALRDAGIAEYKGVQIEYVARLLAFRDEGLVGCRASAHAERPVAPRL